MIVVDASVLVELLGEGPPKAAVAAALNGDPEWAVPLGWRIEIANVLATRMRHGVLTLDVAVGSHALIAGIINGREHAVDPNRVLRACAASGCTAYDCEYVVLAENLGVPLVTSDTQVLAAFPGLAITPGSFVERGR